MKMVQNDEDIVKEQYANAVNLNTRISIHQKYSVNKQSFGNWIVSQYELKDNFRILELGCGNGTTWKENYRKIPFNTSLVLTDFSEGMLEEAKNNVPKTSSISFKQADIQNIPFDNKSFDVVIANMMLYHVPRLDKGLTEVVRVLKSNGTFYCATYGENGITEYLQELFSDYEIKNELNNRFTLQNGRKILSEYFETVEKRLYKDALEVTNTDDFINYMMSLTSMVDYKDIPRNEVRRILDGKKINGKIHVPKECGMFISRN